MKSAEMLKHIKLLVIDVGGTMTNGEVRYDENRNELKNLYKRCSGLFKAY